MTENLPATVLTAIPMPAYPPAVRSWRRPSWLSGWSAAHPVPASLVEVNTALRRIEDLLEQARPEAIAVLLAEPLEYYGKPKNWSTKTAELYIADLEMYPAWAIEDALKTCRQTSEFFPRISAILKAIPQRYHEMHTDRLTLRTAQMMARWAA